MDKTMLTRISIITSVVLGEPFTVVGYPTNDMKLILWAFHFESLDHFYSVYDVVEPWEMNTYVPYIVVDKIGYSTALQVMESHEECYLAGPVKPLNSLLDEDE